MILRKKIYCKSPKNEWESYHNKIVWLNFVLMQDSWQRLMSDSTSWQKTLKNSHNLQSQWLVVSTLCQETNKHLNRKVRSEGIPKLGPYWKLQPVACTVNMELRLNLVSEQRQFSLLGQNFWWPEQVCDEFEQQWAGNSRSSARRICVKIGCERFCMPIKG